MLRAVTLSGSRIVVGIGGGIAAFKAVQLVRELGRQGAEVRVVMTPAATRFVGAVTLTGLTGHPAVVDLWDPAYRGEVHVELGQWADAMVVAPATMNLLARAAHGHANDALLATLACCRGPVVVAPAMHPQMWSRASTQRNMATLVRDGVHQVGPVAGPLASGESGMGRMAEPEAICAGVAEALRRAAGGPPDMEGMRVLVSAGPTYEDLDPVRFLGNRSSGKMGFALASTAHARGAEVFLVSGPVTLPDPAGVNVTRVRSAREMHAAIVERVGSVDVVVMAAAVADYRPDVRATEKIKKAGERALQLVRNPDILAELGATRARATAEDPSKRRPVLIGFALETSEVERHARQKLDTKQCDLIVANEARDGFGGDTNRAHFVTASGVLSHDTMSKDALSEKIWDSALRIHRERDEAGN